MSSNGGSGGAAEEPFTLAGLLAVLDSISVPSRASSKALTFVSQLEHVLHSLVRLAYSSDYPAQDCSWAHVFHVYLWQNNEPLQISRIEHYLSLCDAFLLQADKANPISVLLARKLQRYLRTHRIDSCNALVGLRLSSHAECTYFTGCPLVEMYHALTSLGAALGVFQLYPKPSLLPPGFATMSPVQSPSRPQRDDDDDANNNNDEEDRAEPVSPPVSPRRNVGATFIGTGMRDLETAVIDHPPTIDAAHTLDIASAWTNIDDEERSQRAATLCTVIELQEAIVKFWPPNQTLTEGDLVVALHPQLSKSGRPRLVFFRYSGVVRRVRRREAGSGFVCGDQIRVYTTPDELSHVDIDLRLALPVVHGSELEAAISGNVLTMRLLVDEGLGKIESAARRRLQRGVLAKLESHGVNVDLLNRCTQLSNITFEELEAIEETRNHLRMLLADQRIEFADVVHDIRQYVRDRYLAFITDSSSPDVTAAVNATAATIQLAFDRRSLGIDSFSPTSHHHHQQQPELPVLEICHEHLIGRVFAPTRSLAVKSLQNLPVEALIMHRLEHYISYCTAALATRDELKMRLLDGTHKKQITEWWLRLIHKRQDQFLAALGYDFTAIPRNYIESPPTSIEAVQNNLRIIREILNVKEDIHNAQKLLVAELKNEIYPKIDEYVRNAECAIADALGESAPLGPTSEDLVGPNSSSTAADQRVQRRQYLFKLFAQRARKMNPAEASRLESLIKDIGYLCQIQEMENAPPPGPDQPRRLDVVPISGLVMSGIHRTENVLRTVLEVWAGPRSRPSSPTDATSLSSSPPMPRHGTAAIAIPVSPRSSNNSNATPNSTGSSTSPRSVGDVSSPPLSPQASFSPASPPPPVQSDMMQFVPHSPPQQVGPGGESPSSWVPMLSSAVGNKRRSLLLTNVRGKSLPVVTRDRDVARTPTVVAPAPPVAPGALAASTDREPIPLLPPPACEAVTHSSSESSSESPSATQEPPASLESSSESSSAIQEPPASLESSSESSPTIQEPPASLESSSESPSATQEPPASLESSSESPPAIHEPPASLESSSESPSSIQEPPASLESSSESPSAIQEPPASLESSSESPPAIQETPASLESSSESPSAIHEPPASLESSSESSAATQEPPASLESSSESSPAIQETPAPATATSSAATNSAVSSVVDTVPASSASTSTTHPTSPTWGAFGAARGSGTPSWGARAVSPASPSIVMARMRGTTSPASFVPFSENLPALPPHPAPPLEPEAEPDADEPQP